MKTQKTILCIGGVSGSGKSTLAKYLESLTSYFDQAIGEDIKQSVICCSDDYFMVDGEYRFDPSKLSQAHQQCKEKCRVSAEVEIPLIIVANTTTTPKELKPYQEIASTYGYTLSYVMVVPTHDCKDSHSVPDTTKQKQAKRLVHTFEQAHKVFE